MAEERIVSDDPERTRLQREVGELRERDRVKVEFLAMAAHDIANAVATLDAAGQLMASRLDPESRGDQLLDITSNALLQISRLADDLVDWAAMERGSLRLRPTRFGPASLMEETLRGFRVRAATKGIRFESVLEPVLRPVTADRRRLGQVLMNLLENALRYTPGGGRIVLGARSDAGRLALMVMDSGAGMDPERLRALSSGLGPVDHADGRLGLGLSIVRAIVRLHQGTFQLRSDGPGKGMSCTVTIPDLEQAP